MKNKLFITTLCVFATISQTTSVFAEEANCSLNPKNSACTLETYKKMVSQKKIRNEQEIDHQMR